MEVPQEIIYNVIMDWKKKNINPIDKARFLKAYIEKEGISQRELARRLDIPHSTIQDWISYAEIEQQDYNTLKELGYNETQIYKAVRNNRLNKKRIKEIVNRKEINNQLKLTNTLFYSYINNPEYDEYTLDLIKELVNTLNRLSIKIEKTMKGGK